MQKIVTGAVCLTLGTLLAAAPAGAQNREHQQMAADLRIVQEQNQQLRATVDRLSQVLADLMAAMDANQRFQQQRFADIQTLLGSLETEVGVVRERVQDTETRIRTLGDDMGALQSTFLTLPAQIREVLNARQEPPPGDGGAVGQTSLNTPPDQGPDVPIGTPPPSQPTVALPPTAGLSPTMLYNAAYADYTSGQRYDLAIDGFRQVLQYFPQAELADDAQYYIGEAYVHLSQFGEAIAAYEAVLRNYPQGERASMASYKRGSTLERLGNVDAARTAYDETMNTYPNSEGALFAKERLGWVNTQTGQP
jgi:tol-pal system protein YbgF